MIVLSKLLLGLFAGLATGPVVFATDAGPQDPDPVVARFRLGDRSDVITRTDLALEVAFRRRRTSTGEAALKLLVDRQLVEDAATAAGLSASRAEVEERIEQIRQALKQQGQTLESFLAAKGMTTNDFERNFVALSIAHERLVVKALDLDSRSDVRPETLELWLREERARRNVIEGEDSLPPGVVARIDGESIEMVELGTLLLTDLDDEERFKSVRRIVLRRALAQRARELGIEVDASETRVEVERRRIQIENDPRFRGVAYADWLRETQGLTIEDLLNSDQMVATVQQRKIVERLHPDEQLVRHIAENRDAVLRAHGEKRDIAIVLVRAREEPDQVVERDFDQALEQIRAAQARLDEGLSFADVAAIYSEDPYSKVRGGQLGEFFRGDDDVPDEVLEVAFAISPGTLSAPVRVPQGWALVTVTDVVPAPDDAELADRLREALGQQLLRDLVEQAAIEMVER